MINDSERTLAYKTPKHDKTTYGVLVHQSFIEPPLSCILDPRVHPFKRVGFRPNTLVTVDAPCVRNSQPTHPGVAGAVNACMHVLALGTPSLELAGRFHRSTSPFHASRQTADVFGREKGVAVEPRRAVHDL